MELAYLIVGATVLGMIVLVGFIVLALINRRASKPSSWTPPTESESPSEFDPGPSPDMPPASSATSPFGRIATGSAQTGSTSHSSGGMTMTSALIFLVLFGLAGLGMAGIGIYQGFRLVSSSAWPATEGRVLSSYVDSYVDSDGDTLYRAEVSYEYVVNGTVYQNNLVRFGGNSGSTSARRSQQRIVDRYPQGDSILVYYDPDSPEDAVLERKLSPGMVMITILGLVFGGVGVVTGGGEVLKNLRSRA